MAQEELSFDQKPRYCLLCLPKPSHSCPRASYSLPRYLLMFLPDTPLRKKTSKNYPGHLTDISAQIHHKKELHFSDSPHLHIPSTTEGGLKAASRIRNISRFPVTSALSSLPSLLHIDLGSPQCSVLVALHYVPWMVQYCLQRRGSAQH